MSKDISKALNIMAPPEKKEEKPVELVPVDMSKMSAIEQELETARANLHDLIDKGNLALDEIMQVASASENPRAYEVAGGVLKTVLEANRDLIALAKQKKEMLGVNAESESQKVVNNNLFVGSTKDLQDMLEKLKNGEQS